MTEIICVPIIVALTYAIIELYKKVVAKTNATLNRIIPLLGLAIGALAGIVCYYAFPELIIAHNIVSAMVVGASSGLSATGCNQIFKQLKKYGITVTEPNAQTDADNTNQPNENLQNQPAQNVDNSTKQPDENSAQNKQQTDDDAEQTNLK